MTAPSKTSAASKRGATFVNYTPAEAQGVKSKKGHARWLATDIPVEHLVQTEAQRKQISAIHQHGQLEDHSFEASDSKDQVIANALLARYGLDTASLNDLKARWSRRWFWTSRGSKAHERYNRVLYQCKCGYAEGEAGTKERHVPLPFTECLGHVEVARMESTGNIIRVAVMTQPIVWDFALRQLREGGSWDDILERNREMVEGCSYPGQDTDWAHSRYRWILNPKDSRSLYRQHHRKEGVQVRTQPHQNVDAWLDPKSPDYNKTFAAAIFHYKARVEKQERFEACIATEEMKSVAWTYGHGSQLILDGTFGVCNDKLLLFILMAVDEDRKGVPLAFLLFSAPSGNRFTAAGYDTSILARLLAKWRDSLGKQSDEPFYPPVAITDTDDKEKNALAQVFPGIWILNCRFHLRQCWRNHRRRELKGDSPAHSQIAGRLRRLEDDLIETEVHSDALQKIEDERAVLHRFKVLDSSATPAVEGGEKHLTYLMDYWVKKETVWKSWSKHGCKVAAQLLGCTFDFVLPTTNHLERFNGLLKNKHLKRWQRNNRRLRLDVLIHLLITRVLPGIFKQRTLQGKQRRGWDDLLHAAGGAGLILRRKTASAKTSPPSITYIIPDANRDAAATTIFAQRQIGDPKLENNNKLTLTCHSSAAFEGDDRSESYTVTLEFDGAGSCSCPDFFHRGGACKHIRAAMLYLTALRESGRNTPSITLPTSVEGARALQAARFSTNVQARAAEEEPSSSSPIDDAARLVEDVLKEGDVYEESDELVVGVTKVDDKGESDEGEEEEDDDERERTMDGFSTNADWELDSSFDRDGWVSERTDGSEFGAIDPRDLGLDDEPENFSESGRSSAFSLRDGEAEESVNAHLLARTFHDLDRTTPRLRALAGTLEDAYIDPDVVEDIEKARAACEDLEALCTQLRRLFTVSKEAPKAVVKPDHHEKSVQTTNESPSTPPPVRKRPRTSYIPRPAIALTPEKKKQHRQESYGS
ncbi:uncharacterized protein STEHIDRAFT_156377 [Stereum hirsutum FP-91666 SS1]|uniref:uncharacterized protein n=1 Tax=Stereum hirsutum (strain FP-91666) TaxID=721885 RepID=UPI000440AAFD|nr:uncharacterized protein STEHIDRAFT_156377 [Stereum hirsutum FP-91666 SS1]EIM87406.1 hypothetical protein STEHIDRAFT_156377 [Stereum hirsutum FP-91666 SS1]